MNSKNWSKSFNDLLKSDDDIFHEKFQELDEENRAFREMMVLFDKSVRDRPIFLKGSMEDVAKWVTSKIKDMLLANEEPARTHYSQALKSNRALAFELKKQSERSNLYSEMCERDFLIAVAYGIGQCVADSQTRETAKTTQLNLERPHSTSVARLIRDENELERQNRVISTVESADRDVILLLLRSGQLPSEVSKLMGNTKEQIVDTLFKYEDVKRLLTSSN